MESVVLLPDYEIVARIKDGALDIDPFDATRVQPASVDLTMDNWVRLHAHREVLDVRRIPEGHTKSYEMPADGLTLAPGDFLLASTRERVHLPADLAGRVEGRSSLWRLGIAVHITAGFIDPGFSGQITLEVANLGPWPIVLRPGMSIAQIAFTPMLAPPDLTYGQAGNHYQGQLGPTESRYRMEG